MLLLTTLIGNTFKHTSDMLQHIKITYPNLYIIIVAIALIMWIEGANMIVSRLFKRTLKVGVLLCLTALGVFYFDDGYLNELYDFRMAGNPSVLIPEEVNANTKSFLPVLTHLENNQQVLDYKKAHYLGFTSTYHILKKTEGIRTTRALFKNMKVGWLKGLVEEDIKMIEQQRKEKDVSTEEAKKQIIWMRQVLFSLCEKARYNSMKAYLDDVLKTM